VAEDAAAGLGGRDLASADVTLDQPRADQLLERGELLTDRGLAVAELPGGGREGALLDDGSQREQMPELDAAPPKTIGYI
jgi:hypothetical protein